MTNAEMIELAAKAAGYVLTDGSEGYRTFRCYAGSEWNPRNDDGDLLRLAVKLRIEIEHNHPLDLDRYVKAYLSGAASLLDPISFTEEFDEEDHRLEATRLAVLRVAAAIGSYMP